MGKKNPAAGDMLPFGDEADFESASQLMTNRTRFEALAPPARARLAETLMAAPMGSLMAASGSDDEADLEDFWQEYLSGALDVVESVRGRDTCYICHNAFEEGDKRIEQRIVWVDEGKKVHSEVTGESGHERCIVRLREGDAETKPMF